MDIEGRLHSAQRRSQSTMMKSVQTVNAADRASDDAAIRGRVHPLAVDGARRRAGALECGLAWLLSCTLALALHAQAPATGPQQLAFAGLRAALSSQGQPQGQINAVRVGATGNLYLLIDQKDGVRLIETDPAATNILNQAQIGAKGDVGLAMALDPAGNVYVTGTTTSGALTATGGAAFTAASGTATNSFVAKFSASLGSPIFVTFCGGGSMDASSIAATSDAVFITGTVYLPNGTLPVTAAGIIQTPAFGSQWNGFVEKFSASGSSLLSATYLSGAGGNTTPAAIVADSSDDAYIAGTTTAPGYPTVAALVPNQLVTTALGTTSGFLTKLTPAGDGIPFSTFIPGAGTSSLAIDSVAGNLLLAGPISLGQFPVGSVATPLTAIGYQVLVRMTLDGQTVLGSTVLAPGTQSFVAAGAAGTAWVDGSLGLPLLPLTPFATIGNSFAVRVNAANLVDQTARFGGIASSNPNSASAPVSLTSVAIDASGNALVGGSFAPSASQSLLATETFDLPLNDAPTAAFPSTVRGAVLPVSACNGSLCAGAAAYLAKLTIPANAGAATAALALSVDDSPNITLRNLGSALATGVQIVVSGGFTQATNCGTTLAAGGECSIALTGSGPGSITVSAANSTAQTQALPALASGVMQLPVVFSPKELDFGVVSSASGAVTRTITVTNLTQQSQSFASQWDIGSRTTLPYTFAQTATDCTLAGSNFLLAPGGVCHITIGLMASSSCGKRRRDPAELADRRARRADDGIRTGRRALALVSGDRLWNAVHGRAAAGALSVPLEQLDCLFLSRRRDAARLVAVHGHRPLPIDAGAADGLPVATCLPEREDARGRCGHTFAGPGADGAGHGPLSSAALGQWGERESQPQRLDDVAQLRQCSGGYRRFERHADAHDWEHGNDRIYALAGALGRLYRQHQLHCNAARRRIVQSRVYFCAVAAGHAPGAAGGYGGRGDYAGLRCAVRRRHGNYLAGQQWHTVLRRSDRGRADGRVDQDHAALHQLYGRDCVHNARLALYCGNRRGHWVRTRAAAQLRVHHQRNRDLHQLLGGRAVHAACDRAGDGHADDQLGGGGQPVCSLTDRKGAAAHRTAADAGGAGLRPGADQQRERDGAVCGDEPGCGRRLGDSGNARGHRRLQRLEHGQRRNAVRGRAGLHCELLHSDCLCTDGLGAAHGNSSTVRPS